MNAEGLLLLTASAGVHIIAVATPGQDFALVLNRTLQRGFTSGVAAAIGIGTGVLLLCLAIVFGGHALATAIDLGGAYLRIAAATLLLWLGLRGLLATTAKDAAPGAGHRNGRVRGMALGLVTNLFNAKAWLFFIAVYAAYAAAAIPSTVQLIMAAWFGAATAAVFCALAWLFHRGGRWLGSPCWMRRASAALLCLIAVVLLLPLLV